MPDIECPGCGTVSRLELGARTAEEFCAECDFPLFWAPAALERPSAPGGPLDSSLRRLPGTAGRTLVATIACPICAEPNPVRNERCLRCGADLRPAPEPEPPPPPPVVVEAPPPPPLPPPPRQPVWPWIVLAVLALAAVAVLVWALWE